MEFVALLMLAFAGLTVIASFGRLLVVAKRGPASDRSLAEDADASRLGELAERKEMVMQLILSTQLDLDTNKISDEDHAKTHLKLTKDAVAIMKEMEALGGTDEDLSAVDSDLDEHLAALRVTDTERAWSAAARLRHGGQAPGVST
ncbi:MAG: hypothetical protein ACJAYU_004684 [Bradymonadia bacterium]|jgi:hypothetical protein